MPLVLGTLWSVASSDIPVQDPFDLRYFGSGLAFHLTDVSYPNNWNIFWGTLRRSTDSGTSWTDLTNGSLGCVAYDRAADGRIWALWVDITAANQWYIYYSDDSGTTWTLNLTPTVSTAFVEIACHPTDANTVAVVCGSGKYFSGTATRFTANRGSSWSSAVAFTSGTSYGGTALTYWNPPCRLKISSTSAWIVLGGDNRILRSTNSGTSWTTVKASTSSTISQVGELIRSGNSGPFFAYRGTGTVMQTPLYRSTDDGVTWDSLAFPVGVIDVRAMAYDSGSDILVIVTDTTVGAADQNYWLATAGVVASGLEVWTEIANAPYESFGTHPFYSSIHWTINTLAVMDSDLYIATNWDYERLSAGTVVAPPGPGGGGGSQLLTSPFSRSILDRFQRNVIADRRPERLRGG